MLSGLVAAGVYKNQMDSREMCRFAIIFFIFSAIAFYFFYLFLLPPE
jgi:hypothetical protein